MTSPLSDEYAAIEAERQLYELMRQGKAEDVLMTYSFCKQSCDYVYGIVRSVAYDETECDEPAFRAVREFALNLLDDWSK